MHRVYSWPPVEVVVEAPEDGPSYKVKILSGDFQSPPMEVDAHLGADGAARAAVEVYSRAFCEPRRFLAEERMEARHLPKAMREGHMAWAESVVQGASILGDRIEKAARQSIEPTMPLNVSGQIEDYLGLVEVGHELAIHTLIAEGHSPAKAREILAERTLQDFANKWRLVPSRRLPTAARG